MTHKIPDPTMSEGDSGTHKWCTNCGKRKEKREFDVDMQKKDSRRDVCKACRSEIRAAELERVSMEAIQEMEEDSFRQLKNISGGGSYTPHTEEMLESIMRPFGGVQGYAKHLYQTYLAAPPGSARRVQMHKMIMELTMKVTEHDSAGQRIEDMESEDLQRMMATCMAEWQKKARLPQTAIPTLEGSVVDTAKERKESADEPG